MNKQLVMLFIATIAVAGFFIFGNRYFQKLQPEKYTGSVEDIHLGVSSAGQQLSALIYIADKNGYFTDNKLNVKW